MATFHLFKDVTTLWSDVFPGDGLVCSGCIAFHFEDFYSRNTEARALELRHRPTFVIARIPGVGIEAEALGYRQPREFVDWKLDTFMLWTRHGVLCTVMRVLQ